MITLAQKKGLTDIGPYIFRNSMTASLQAKTIAGFALDRLMGLAESRLRAA
jgi:hypothetical protein